MAQSFGISKHSSYWLRKVANYLKLLGSLHSRQTALNSLIRRINKFIFHNLVTGVIQWIRRMFDPIQLDHLRFIKAACLPPKILNPSGKQSQCSNLIYI